jgi:hypothetical protein
MDLTTEDQYNLLGPRHGDDAPNRFRRRGVWGKASLLSQRGLLANTFVSTEPLDIITPIAFQLTFSADGQTFSPFLPSTSNAVEVRIVRSIDPHTGAFSELFTLSPGDAQPVCQFLARALSISVSLTGENPADLYVHCAAAPTTAFECGASTGVDPNGPNQYIIAAKSTIAAPGLPVSPTSVLVWPANPKRTQLFCQNGTDVDMLLGFGTTPTLSPRVGSILLPGGQNAIWESEPRTFMGDLYVTFASTGTTGAALFTEGRRA